MLDFCVGFLCWIFVLDFCVGFLCWIFVLDFCVGFLCWIFVLDFCVGERFGKCAGKRSQILCWIFVLDFVLENVLVPPTPILLIFFMKKFPQ